MNARQLREGSALSVGHTAHPPSVKPLRSLPEMRLDHARADGLEESVMGVELFVHAPLYQHSVYVSRGQTFIGSAAMLMHKLAVAHDPAFGARLRETIHAAGFKNPRRFAIDGMGWPESAGPQRLNQYLKGRMPDIETLFQLADALRVSLPDLLGMHDANGVPDEGLKGILQYLLELEGIPPDKADTIASASLAAQRLLRAFPEEEPLQRRARYAAHAAWLQQPSQAPDR